MPPLARPPRSRAHRSYGWVTAIALGACGDPGGGAEIEADVLETSSDDASHDVPVAPPEVGDDGGAPPDTADTAEAPDTADTAEAPDTTETPDTSPDTGPPPPDLTCLGPSVPLVRVRDLPYVEVKIGAARGLFLVDFASTSSTIDPAGFEGGTPTPEPGSDRYRGFDFFGPWAPVTLARRDYSSLDLPVRQAGILGTDFLSLHVYTVYMPAPQGPGSRRSTPSPDALRSALGADPRLYRADAEGATGVHSFCTQAHLRGLGFASASTSGYYSAEPWTLPPNRPNVPVVPIRVGGVEAPAQLDTGFDDHLVPSSVNANAALFDLLPAGAVTRAPALDLLLSTCVPGVSEQVLAHHAPGLELVLGPHAFPEAVLFEKRSPPAAASCGGIGTWSEPAAQLGASFVASLGLLAIDPFAALTWAPAP